jgi:cytochrome oxidase Cu insertion factor (SCO1/SenC/PrrC family)
MARKYRRKSLTPFFLAVGAIALIALVYFSWNASVRRDRAELPRYGFAPEFRLTDQDGIPVDKERLRGKIWIAGFIDVADTDSSALLSSRFAELDQNFRKGERLTLVSMVLPAVNQSVPKLADLARHYLASSRWRFVEGTSAETHDLLDRWERIASVQTDGKVVVSHFFLVDSDGIVRGEYDGRSPEAVQRILEDIGTLLRSGAK